MNDDNANNEPTAKILSFPTEQRRVSVATEREEGMIFTPEHLKSLLEFDDLIKIDLDRLDLTIKSDHDSFTYNWNEFMEGVDLTKEPDKTIFSIPKDPYVETLKTVASLLVEAHRLKSLSKDSQLDDLNHYLNDLLSWLKDI